MLATTTNPTGTPPAEPHPAEALSAGADPCPPPSGWARSDRGGTVDHDDLAVDVGVARAAASAPPVRRRRARSGGRSGCGGRSGRAGSGRAPRTSPRRRSPARRVDQHPAAHLAGQRPGRRVHAALGGGVRDQAGVAALRADRGDDDDPAAPPLAEHPCAAPARVSSSGAVRLVSMIRGDLSAATVCTCSESWPTAALLTRRVDRAEPRLDRPDEAPAPPAASVTSTAPTCTRSGCSAASVLQLGGDGAGERGDLRARREQVGDDGQAEPRDPPETRTTVRRGRGAGSDIALQGLLDRDLGPAGGCAAARRSRAAGRDAPAAGRARRRPVRAGGLCEDDVGGHDPADERRRRPRTRAQATPG